MLKITAEKTRILHMGDVGHALDDATREKCGEIDVLLAPTGGAPTISLPDLLEFIEKLAPKIVIPMHFGVPNLAMNALPLEAFLEVWRGPIRREDGASISWNKGIVPRETTVCVLEPLRVQG